jgi:hypothetical protein
MRPTCPAREAPRRRGALYIETKHGLQLIVEAKPWGKNIGLLLEDHRFVVVEPSRHLVTSKGKRP